MTEETTHDRMGRRLIPDDERRRVQALELAVATFRSPQNLHQSSTGQLIVRAKAFEKYILSGDL